MRFRQSLGHLAIKDPDLFRPVFARPIKGFTFLALAFAETIRLAKVDTAETAVEMRSQIAIDKFLHVRIRQTVLAVAAVRLQT